MAQWLRRVPFLNRDHHSTSVGRGFNPRPCHFFFHLKSAHFFSIELCRTCFKILREKVSESRLWVKKKVARLGFEPGWPRYYCRLFPKKPSALTAGPPRLSNNGCILLISTIMLCLHISTSNRVLL